MSATIFLTVDQVLAIHADQIQRYGGSTGILSRDMLEAAAAIPQQSFGGELLHPDAPSQAAAYLYHLVKNHAFADGNKRVGAASAVVFLIMNGVHFELTEDELADVTLGVASGEISKAELTTFFRSRVRGP